MRFDTMIKVKRALISVYDKRGVVPFARALHHLGVEILSTGGTAGILKKHGLSVKEVSSVTRFPEMLDGRVKTLHPHLHAGILAVRDNPGHMKALETHGILPIDMLVVNLYPFGETVKSPAKEKDVIEMIDIGGPAMLRSAAKNFRFVAAVSDPADYEAVRRELEESRGAVSAPRGRGNPAPTLSETTSRRLAAKVFGLTSRYDGMIRDYFDVGARSPRPEGGETPPLPDHLTLDFKKIKDLRYGENPHQKGALYADANVGAGPADSVGRVCGAGVVGAQQLHGKELSFNNILDLDAALEMVSAFRETVCAIIKHTNPCGFAIGKNPAAAFRAAYRCDSLSAFGSVVSFNRPVDGRTARVILKSGFIECVLTPSFTPEALRLLKVKKNLRLLTVDVRARLPAGQAGFPRPLGGETPPLQDFKKVQGGLLVQEKDMKDVVAAGLRCVTKTSPTASEMKDLLFTFKVCRFVKSNAIVIAKGGVTVGLGRGQPSRVDSCYTALKKAGKRARGAMLASDGFFPKPDSIALAKKAGIRAIIQPGGSIQDEVVIQAANRARISMVFTGVRHFRH